MFVPESAVMVTSTDCPCSKKIESPTSLNSGAAGLPGPKASSTGPKVKCAVKIWSQMLPGLKQANTSSNVSPKSLCSTTETVCGSSVSSACCQVIVPPLATVTGPGEKRRLLEIITFGCTTLSPRVLTVMDSPALAIKMPAVTSKTNTKVRTTQPLFTFERQ